MSKYTYNIDILVFNDILLLFDLHNTTGVGGVGMTKPKGLLQLSLSAVSAEKVFLWKGTKLYLGMVKKPEGNVLALVFKRGRATFKVLLRHVSTGQLLIVNDMNHLKEIAAAEIVRFSMFPDSKIVFIHLGSYFINLSIDTLTRFLTEAG